MSDGVASHGGGRDHRRVTGIGHACALHLDRSGFRVFAGVRRDEDAERLQGAGSDRLTPMMLDMTDSESIRCAADQVQAELGGGRLSGLVNNAGIAVSGPVEFLPIEEVRKQLEVNFIGQVAVTQAFLPLLRRDHGRIVNIGSVGGEVALPFLSPYAASKHAMEGFSGLAAARGRTTRRACRGRAPGCNPELDLGARERRRGRDPRGTAAGGDARCTETASAAPGPPRTSARASDPGRGGGGLGGACADGAQAEDALRDRARRQGDGHTRAVAAGPRVRPPRRPRDARIASASR